MTSSRLPGKILMDMAGKPSILRQIERIEHSRYVDSVIVATTINNTDDILVNLLEQEGIPYCRGSEDDVLGRVADTAAQFDLDVIVEICGDCPLIDMQEADLVIERYLQGGFDLTANNFLRTYPLGMDTRGISNAVLQEAAHIADDPIHREHVCQFMYDNPFDYSFSNIEAPPFLRDPRLRMTLDYPEDYEFINKVYQELYPRKQDFNLYDIMILLNKKPELREITRGIEMKRIR